MARQVYDLEECIFDNPWLRSQLKEKCALPMGKNVLGYDIYAVREGVTIRAQKATLNSAGKDVRTTLLLRQGTHVVPQAEGVVSNTAFVEAHHTCFAKYEFFPPRTTTSKHFRDAALTYEKGKDVVDVNFDGVARGINSTTRGSHYVSLCF